MVHALVIGWLGMNYLRQLGVKNLMYKISIKDTFLYLERLHSNGDVCSYRIDRRTAWDAFESDFSTLGLDL